MSALTIDDLRTLSTSINRFIAEQHNFEKRRQTVANDTGFDVADWQRYADMGWLGLAIPEPMGGLGGGMAALAVLMQAAGAGLLTSPLLATLVLGAGAIELAGDSTQQETFLPAVVAGEITLALAHREAAAGHDLDGTRCLAKKSTDGHRLSGKKNLVLHGATASHLVVSARYGERGPVNLFMVDAGAPGLGLNTYRLLDGRPAADLVLDNVFVPEHNRLATEDASAAIDQLHQRAATASCAEACGAMSALIDITLEYVKTRRQFGTAIGHFQVIQHRLVEMSIASQEATAITGTAAIALDNAWPDSRRLVAAAKVRTSQAGRFIGEQGVQLHGGMGMAEELPVGTYLKLLLTNSSLFGDADWHREVFDYQNSTINEEKVA